MRGHRLARPERTRLPGGIVTNREHKIELRSVRANELVPVFGAVAIGVEVQLAQEIERVGMDPPLRLAAGRERAEHPASFAIENGLGNDRSGRVARAEKQNVERLLSGCVAFAKSSALPALVAFRCGRAAPIPQHVRRLQCPMPVATIGDRRRRGPAFLRVGVVNMDRPSRVPWIRPERPRC